MLNWRHLTLAIAFALINAASSTDAARAGESARTAKRVLMVPARVAMRPPWLFLAGALSTTDFRHLVSLASPGSLAGGGSGTLR